MPRRDSRNCHISKLIALRHRLPHPPTPTLPPASLEKAGCWVGPPARPTCGLRGRAAPPRAPFVRMRVTARSLNASLSSHLADSCGGAAGGAGTDQRTWHGGAMPPRQEEAGLALPPGRRGGQEASCLQLDGLALAQQPSPLLAPHKPTRPQELCTIPGKRGRRERGHAPLAGSSQPTALQLRALSSAQSQTDLGVPIEKTCKRNTCTHTPTQPHPHPHPAHARTQKEAPTCSQSFLSTVQDTEHSASIAPGAAAASRCRASSLAAIFSRRICLGGKIEIAFCGA